jgi:hypothetical protein
VERARKDKHNFYSLANNGLIYYFFTYIDRRFRNARERNTFSDLDFSRQLAILVGARGALLAILSRGCAGNFSRLYIQKFKVSTVRRVYIWEHLAERLTPPNPPKQLRAKEIHLQKRVPLHNLVRYRFEK